MPEVLMLDPFLASEFVAARAASGADRIDEVWNGRIVGPPAPNTEHFRITSRFTEACSSVVNWNTGDQASPGGNVSDRNQEWIQNYRAPDALVYFSSNPAINHGTHFEGGVRTSWSRSSARGRSHTRSWTSTLR
jgi:hypothetical protein